MFSKKSWCLGVFCLIVVFVGGALAGVYPLITIQGLLTDDTGAPVADGTCWIRFKLFDHPTSGTELWSTGSYVEVTVDDGLFSYLLGSNAPLDPSIADNDSLWVEIKLDGSEPMTPRLRLTPTVWSLRAIKADTADFAQNVAPGVGGWTDDGTVVRLSYSGDEVGIGTANPDAKLHVSTTGADTRLNSILGAVYGADNSSGAIGILGGMDYGVSGTGDAWGTKGITTTGYGVIGGTSNTSGTGVYGTNINGNYGYLGGSSVGVYGNNAGGGHSGYFDGKFYVNGNVGIGAQSPKNKLDVKGRMVIGNSYGGTKTAPSNGLLVEGRVGIGMSIPNHKLYVHEKVNGLAYPIKIDNSDYHWNSAVGILFSTGGEGGGILDTVRAKGALVYEYNNTWNRGSFHILQESSTDSSNPGLADAVMTIKNNGNVGIGNTNPDAKLDVNGNLEVSGDLVVAGAYRGNLGSGGAPFPRPAYDSGWLDILPGSEATFTHNIGVDVNKYIVDLQFKSLHHGLGIHTYGLGGYGGNVGVFWKNMTTTTIKVYREEDDWLADQVRVRIWMTN